MDNFKNQIGVRKFLIGFSKLFPGEKPQSLIEYLGEFDRNDLLHAATFLVGLKTRDSEYEDNHEFLRRWFNPQNAAFFNELDSNLRSFEEDCTLPVVILNPISSLQIFEFAFNSLNNNGFRNDGQLEINLIKAYLMLNERITNLEYVTQESIKDVDSDLRWWCLNFCSNFRTYEFLHFYIGESSAAQIIKAIYLFEFLSDSNELKWVLEEFLRLYGHQDWKSYLKAYLPLTHSLLKKPKEGYLEIVVNKDGSYEASCNFLDKFIIQDNDLLDEYDFRSVRANPLYKYEEGKYRVVYDLFAIEKIFTGLYFKLAEVYNNSNRDLQNIGNFRSFYTDEFCEKHLLYRTIKSCFPKKFIHVTGKELKEKGLQGEPDYYLRFKNKVFLIENKDVLIPAEAKQSCDYRLLEPELLKRFYFEKKGDKTKNGAVLQLVNNIAKILTNKFHPDKEIKKEFVTIFPILVLHYNQYNTPGLNRILNHWFQIELNKLAVDGINVSNVQPLVIVDIDTLILNSEYLRSRQIIIENIILNYANEMKSKLFIIPFSNLLTNFAIKNKFNKSPSLLHKSGSSLFE